MNDLPLSTLLPISSLAACFNEVTNSYKFYWFLSILEHLREEQSRIISINSLLGRMIASVWYPHYYFRLSFGKQDRLANVVNALNEQNHLPVDSSRIFIIEKTRSHLTEMDAIGKEIISLANYVPYRFLRPFFAKTLRGVDDWEINRRIETLAQTSFDDSKSPCLYKFVSQPNHAIEIHPDWFNYIQQHISILTGFCFWHLINYLQKNNPNTPNIASKLFEPQRRDLRIAKSFWKTYLKQTGYISCIYSDQVIREDEFSLDHFMPWRFVAHDLLWNIIPTPKSVNSAKSDSLPDYLKYFDSFAKLQHQAVRFLAKTPQNAKLLEDHILLFKTETMGDFQTMDFKLFRNTMHNIIGPQFQIAINMGFPSDWKYSK